MSEEELSVGSVELNSVHGNDTEQDEDLELSPVLIKIADDEREDVGQMIVDLYQYRKGYPSRAKQRWKNAMFSHVCIIVILVFGFYVAYSSTIQPVLGLRDWIQYDGCQVQSYKLDFTNTLLSIIPIIVLEVTYPYQGAQVKAFATQSVNGMSQTMSQSDFLTDALQSLNQPRTCYVSPNNVYRVALYNDESLSPTVLVLHICIFVLLILQLVAFVQTWRNTKVRLLICCPAETPQDRGYASVAHA
mmetsp:Transcript_23493/g.46293  ORF Transcript_23493/g.46293 Transcript_23493/m.46293 type:complete len:246 (+) Transcript_23493:33-770(+)|eukprot:CAMPEP_0175122454 /NCGR_PEP_ID=MMETSP0087-20121206/1725_1 /TAXON_ID=136419 /ORGANISM="Unknown Unknown, Strain D1" /LENGTH=245 /DNA_ID=CAMNT_0016404093 /DNA_START=28 /DNA_END=765 /DNA_ORIENTATION=-